MFLLIGVGFKRQHLHPYISVRDADMKNQNLKQEVMNQYQGNKKGKLYEDVTRIEINGVTMNLLEAVKVIKGRILQYQESRAKTCPECGSRRGK